MKITENIYPYNTDVKTLPFYLTGVGGSEQQIHILRSEGYYWHQILFSVNGNGTLKFDDCSVSIEKGDFFFLPMGYPHEYIPDSEQWEVQWVAFDGYACCQTLEQFGMTKPLILRPAESSAMQSIFGKLYTSQKTDRMMGCYTCSGLVYDCILEFHRLSDTTENKLRHDRSRLLTPALNYIDENYRNDFPLTILAEKAGVSPQHLCRVFKEVFRMRPNEYLTVKRLDEAKMLLHSSELSIAEIAVQTGFSDAGYFSTVFKSHESLTPTEYRKRFSIE